MIRAATLADFAWLTARTGYTMPSNARGVLAEARGRILGLVAFDTWTPNSAHVHVVVECAAACVRLLREALAYAFAHVGVLFGCIRSSNARSLRLARRLGFRQVALLADGWALGEALHLLQLRREECRFLPEVTHG